MNKSFRCPNVRFGVAFLCYLQYFVWHQKLGWALSLMIKLEKVRVFVERYFQQYCSLGVPSLETRPNAYCTNAVGLSVSQEWCHSECRPILCLFIRIYQSRNACWGHLPERYFCFCRYGVECISYHTSDMTTAMVTTDARQSINITNSDLYSNSTASAKQSSDLANATTDCPLNDCRTTVATSESTLASNRRSSASEASIISLRVMALCVLRCLIWFAW